MATQPQKRTSVSLEASEVTDRLVVHAYASEAPKLRVLAG
jgi:hypothetical protein